jgi:hypothetical protein
MLGRKKKYARRPPARPRLEALEARYCPVVTFTWKPTVNGTTAWERNSNWTNDGGLNDYPGDGRANDVVVFDGGADNTLSAVMSGTGGAGYTLSSLQIKNGWTKSLTMKYPLVLTGDSQMTSNADIFPDNTGATLTQQTGTFTWTNGSIAHRMAIPVKSTFSVGSPQGATLLVNITTNVFLGSDLAVLTNGTVLLQNTGTLLLYNRATVTNNGTIQISVDNVAGIDKAGVGDAAVTITNDFGTIRKSGGTGTYLINEPVLNQNYGAIKVNDGHGTLSFGGQTLATSGKSVYQTGAHCVIELGGTSEIYAQYGFRIDNGTVQCVGVGFNCTLSAANGQNFDMNGGSVELGSTNDPGQYGTLTLDVPNVNWNGGGFDFFYDLGDGAGSQVVVTGTGGMTIAAAGPSVALEWLGSGTMPCCIDLFVSSGGNITDRSDPAPPGWTGAVSADGKKYTITEGPSPIGGAGCLPLATGVAAPSSAVTGEALAADLYFAYAHSRRQLSDDLGPTAA